MPKLRPVVAATHLQRAAALLLLATFAGSCLPDETGQRDGGSGGTGGSMIPGGDAGADRAGNTGAGGTSGLGGSGGGSGGTGGTGGTTGAGGTGGAAGTGGTGGTGGAVDAGRDVAADRAIGTGGTSPDGGAAGGAGGGGLGGAGGAPRPAAVVWSRNVRVNDDTGTGNQSEVALASGPNGLVLAGWMDSRAARVCAFSFSTDGGVTWSRNVSIPNATGMFVGDPAVAIDGGGTLYAVCQEYLNVGTTGNIRMMTSTDRGVTWSAIRTIQGAPDKPWAGGGTADGTVFVSWLGQAAGIKRSLDHGLTWGPIQPLGNIIHGTAITASTTGVVHVPYNLDSNRNQLRYLRSRDNGTTWDATRDLVADMGTFCFSCSPRQHPIVGAGADPTGRVAAFTWTSRMPAGQGDDDVWVLYTKDGGTTWTQPIRVNDNTAMSRQFESWVAVDNYGRVHVAWTDLRNGQNETFYARSADPTMGFEPNIQVTDGRGSAATDFLGDYKGIVVSGPDVVVVWQDTRRDSGDIYSARAAGAAGP